jgi:hypothetical protein
MTLSLWYKLPDACTIQRVLWRTQSLKSHAGKCTHQGYDVGWGISKSVDFDPHHWRVCEILNPGSSWASWERARIFMQDGNNSIFYVPCWYWFGVTNIVLTRPLERIPFELEWISSIAQDQLLLIRSFIIVVASIVWGQTIYRALVP